ncbi:MAG TPA: hypothetical protein VFS43_21945, partial [Polyangiaceae bacterium]|nr:hypothetical protein [Polyangiaceae bacterium]
RARPGGRGPGRLPGALAIALAACGPAACSRPPDVTPSGPAPGASSAPPAPPPPAPPDDDWPRGRPFFSGALRPPAGAPPFCSPRRPLCVHARSPAEGPSALDALAEAERAYDALRAGPGLPPPAPDGDEGGSPAFDVYLSQLGDSTYRLGCDTPSAAPYDRCAAFGLLDARLGAGCFRKTALHRLVALAMLSAVDAGETGGFFAASASYLALSTTGCLGPVLPAVDRAQARPERALLSPGGPDEPDASPLLPWYFDAAYGAGAPGAFVHALWQLGPQATPPLATRYHNDHDAFTSLAALARHKSADLGELLLDLAVDRAFFGERDDGRHAPPGFAALGPWGRVRFDAAFPFRSLPRRLGFTPLEPTGMVYVWVDLEGAPPGASLALRAAWEKPVSMRWAALRVGPEGAERSRVPIAYEQGAFAAERRVLGLDGLAGVLVVGVNVGDEGPGSPFRPDEWPYEPHAGTLALFAE